MTIRRQPRVGRYKTVAQEFPGVSHYRARHGKLRWRYRKKGFVTNLGTAYASPEFIRRYTAAVRGERLTAAPGEAALRISQAPRGSLSHLIELWYTSPMFKALGDSSARNYRRIAEELRKAHGESLIREIDRGIVKALMAEKADTPNAANHRLRILRFLLDEAVDRDWIKYNMARDVKTYAARTEGFHTWTEAEIAAFQKRWPEGTQADLAMSLMLHTGAARSDAVQLGPAHIRDGRLRYRRQKMKSRQGILVDIPVHPDLWRRLEPRMHMQTFLQTGHGRPRSAPGLGNAMREWCDKAGIPGCTSHGLRKAIARRLAEASPGT